MTKTKISRSASRKLFKFRLHCFYMESCDLPAKSKLLYWLKLSEWCKENKINWKIRESIRRDLFDEGILYFDEEGQLRVGKKL